MNVINLITSFEKELISEFKVEVSKGIQSEALGGALLEIIVDYYLGKSHN